jgi:glucose/arabinose dehydrogenase
VAALRTILNPNNPYGRKGLFNRFVTQVFVLGSLIAITQSAYAITPSIPQGDIVIELESVCVGLTSPVYATGAGDQSGRLFIVDQVGIIRILELHYETCLVEPFLDVSDQIVEINPSFDERGLLGLAFHPRYKNNGRFFVRYSASRAGAPGEPCFGSARGCHEEILAEYNVGNENPNVADPTSERILFRVDEPQFNHDGGNVAFGPDGFLYFALGDGGGAHDGLADTPPSHGPFGNGQNIDTVLGSMLRIDVDSEPEPGLEYAIPVDNPFAGATPGADEIYAYGMRNPYRFSFDDGKRGNGKLYVADVGQGLFEEVNVVQNGGNYGWVVAEGFHCFDPFNPFTPPAACPGTGPHGEPLLNPVAEYNHGDGIAVIGGFVYRGRQAPSLRGKYVFGDFSRDFFPGNGRLFWLDTLGVPTDIFEFQLNESNDDLNLYLFGIGEDDDGELYVLTSSNLGPNGNGGEVWQLVVPGDVSDNNGAKGVFQAVLSGDEEVPPVATEGHGNVVVKTKPSGVRFTLVVNDLQDVVAAHIHCAAEGVNGPVGVTLFSGGPVTRNGVLVQAPLSDVNPGNACGWTSLDDLVEAMDTGNTYVNVHTLSNPSGEVRGQLR